MGKIIDIGYPPSATKAAELQERIHNLIAEYDGEITFMEALGVMRFVEQVMIMRQYENIVGD